MIYFSNADVTASFKGRTGLKSFIQRLFQAEGKPLTSLHYVFCSDEYLLQINRDFLQHDYYTDIITFELAADPAAGVEGEIYISLERVKENGQTLGGGYQEELLRVLFHGALHLCGYRDKTAREIGLMRAAEDKYLERYRQERLG